MIGRSNSIGYLIAICIILIVGLVNIIQINRKSFGNIEIIRIWIGRFTYFSSILFALNRFGGRFSSAFDRAIFTFTQVSAHQFLNFCLDRHPWMINCEHIYSMCQTPVRANADGICLIYLDGIVEHFQKLMECQNCENLVFLHGSMYRRCRKSCHLLLARPPSLPAASIFGYRCSSLMPLFPVNVTPVHFSARDFDKD
jgi:hypothetical protein